MMYMCYNRLQMWANSRLLSDCMMLYVTGDQVSRRGALTGGYYDSRKSRLDLHSDKVKLKQQIEQQERDCQSHKSALEEVEKKVDEIMNEMQRMETRNNKNKWAYMSSRCELTCLLVLAMNLVNARCEFGQFCSLMYQSWQLTVYSYFMWWCKREAMLVLSVLIAVLFY